jgi:hypothetical protein
VKPPLDTDRHLPAVLSREQAVERLLELLPADDADRVWDEIIGALYDARVLHLGWRGGICIRCSVPHPENPRRLSATWPGHRPACPKYVGPLEHRIVSGHQGPVGWRVACSCGQTWLEYDDDGNKRGCPNAALDWRGPRPESEAP